MPLQFGLRPTERGESILVPAGEDGTPAVALHAEVLAHWPPRSKRYREALDGIRQRVQQGAAGPVLPETRMLLEVATPARSRGAVHGKASQTAAGVKSLKALLGRAQVEAPLSSVNLVLFPVRRPAAVTSR